MLRYLIKTLLQMNLFSDTIRNPSNGTDPFFNATLPSFNSSLLDWGNFTGFNGCLTSFIASFCARRWFGILRHGLLEEVGLRTVQSDSNTSTELQRCDD
ncbi:Roundabout -like protein 3 Retinoblastoma-inhibiting gene 1 protein [Channa argus]|uniref:Roundabout-like protein 3 Retinoblastoma-inhibiting gene 1 protein n=1 Tax=Channa argus TaxID=215402 RepID=A0A6G1QXJ1_CHAAH|nr:Roundabout -like protein 3 Retinoblastoma-inhibiting gene 1 protein [Channa argus]